MSRNTSFEYQGSERFGVHDLLCFFPDTESAHDTGKRLPNGGHPPVIPGHSVAIERGTLGEAFKVPLGAIVQDIDDRLVIAARIGSNRSELMWIA